MNKIRNRYEDDEKNEAFRLFCLGLSLTEISKLTEINLRTLERFSANGSWRELRVREKEREAAQIINRMVKDAQKNSHLNTPPNPIRKSE